MHFVIFKGRQQLTPVAIRAGKLLAKRLFGGATDQMDYEMVRCDYRRIVFT